MATSMALPRQLVSSACLHTTHQRTVIRVPSIFLSTRPTQPSPSNPTHQKRHQTTFLHRSSSNPSRTTYPRFFHTTSRPSHPAVSTHRAPPASRKPTKNLLTKDRGPPSKEETQTDFNALNVLGNTVAPSTSVDVCTYDGFMLDSGLRIGDGDGVVLTGTEAFVWRPWMAAGGSAEGGGVVSGSALRKGKNELERTGGVLNQLGQWEVGEEAWGVFKTLWPKPDLLIIGTGPTIRPLAPSTRVKLQELGMRIEVLDTRNAASQFNLLATERGVQEVAAALVPLGFGGK